MTGGVLVDELELGAWSMTIILTCMIEGIEKMKDKHIEENLEALVDFLASAQWHYSDEGPLMEFGRQQSLLRRRHNC